MKKETRISIALSAAITFVAALLTLIAAGTPAPPWAVVCLGLLGFFSLFSIAIMRGWLNAPGDNFVLRFSGSALRTAVVVSAIGTPVGLLCWGAWPPIRRHALDDDERAKFERPLQAQNSDRERIQLACPAADEATCVYAAQFINMFKDAGWKLQSYEVQRVSLGVPYEGIRMFGYVKEYPPSDAPSNVGEWSAITPSMVSIYRAFSSVGIETETGIRKDEEQDVLTLYFGSERPDESRRTQFTGTIEKMVSMKRDYPILYQRYPTL